MLLAIDTSAGTSVAVVDRDAGILSQHDETDTRRHAEVIGDLIAAALRDAGVRPERLSGVVAGMGPGPFTGLRVGIAAARAFAIGIGRPVVPIASHDAVAFAEGRPVLVTTDARRRELAWSAYGAPDDLGLPVRLAGPELIKADAIDIALARFSELPRLDSATIPAGPLGMLAEHLFVARRPFGPTEPLYLRSPDVTLSTPKRVSG